MISSCSNSLRTTLVAAFLGRSAATMKLAEYGSAKKIDSGLGTSGGSAGETAGRRAALLVTEVTRQRLKAFR